MPVLHRMIRIGMVSGFAAVLLVGWVPGCIFGDHGFFDAPPTVIDDQHPADDAAISPILEAPIRPGQTVLWCGTFQLAWNELASLAGGSVQFKAPAPPAAAVLNRKEVDSADFDPDSYVAAAGYVSDGIYARIDKLMLAKFHGEFKPNLPSGDLAAQTNIFAYAFLCKKLDFSVPFERFNDPLKFQGRNIAAFGLDPTQQANTAMAKEISIFDYKDKNDFVVELETKSTGDRLVLAKLAPGDSLARTVEQVEKRLAVPAIRADAQDILEVPKMAFDISHEFGDLADHELIPTTPGIAPESVILAADQNIKFQMNEKGVKLQSEARIAIGCAAQAPREPQHVMIFDKPFLILMQRAGSNRPYFAAWIGNARLLAGLVKAG